MSATGAAQDYNPSTGALSRAVTMSNKCACFVAKTHLVLAGVAVKHCHRYFAWIPCPDMRW